MKYNFYNTFINIEEENDNIFTRISDFDVYITTGKNLSDAID